MASSFDYLDLDGKVDLTNADVEFLVFEDCELTFSTPRITGLYAYR